MTKPKAKTVKPHKGKAPEKPRSRSGPITFTKRAAKLSTHINVRTETHGDNEVQAIDVGVTVGLYARELDKLLGAGAHDRLYTRTPTTDPVPFFKETGPIAIGIKVENVAVTMRLGLARDELKFGKSKLAKIQLTPEDGGMTRCKLQLQLYPEDEQISDLSRHLNTEIELDLQGGRMGKEEKAPDPNQPTLPLDGEAPEPPPEGATVQ